MDRTSFAPDAGAPAFAADPNAQAAVTGMAASGMGGIPTPEAVTPPIADMGAPDAAASPSSTTPVPPSPPTPQFTAEQVAQWQRESQQFAQLQQELRQFAADQQRAQAEANAQRESDERVASIYTQAANMEPEAGFAFVRQQTGLEMARLRGEVQRIQQQSQQQMYAAVAQVAAPLYAQELAKKHGLPAEYAERLAMLPPQQMDAFLPVLQREHQQNQQIQQQLQGALAQIDQLKRSQQAGALAGQGVQTGAGAGVSPVSANPGNVSAGSRDHLLSLPGVAEAFGIRR